MQMVGVEGTQKETCFEKNAHPGKRKRMGEGKRRDSEKKKTAKSLFSHHQRSGKFRDRFGGMLEAMLATTFKRSWNGRNGEKGLPPGKRQPYHRLLRKRGLLSQHNRGNVIGRKGKRKRFRPAT